MTITSRREELKRAEKALGKAQKVQERAKMAFVIADNDLKQAFEEWHRQYLALQRAIQAPRQG